MDRRSRYRGRTAGAGRRGCAGHDGRIQRTGGFRAADRHRRRRPVSPQARRVDRRHVDGPLPANADLLAMASIRSTSSNLRALAPTWALERQGLLLRYRPHDGAGPRQVRANARAFLSGPTNPDAAGNGSLMRLAPTPLLFARRPAEAIAQRVKLREPLTGRRSASMRAVTLAGSSWPPSKVLPRNASWPMTSSPR